MAKNIRENKREYKGHSFKSLNEYGDFTYQKEAIKNDIKKEYMSKDFKLSNFFIFEYKRLEKFAKENNIKIYLTFPTTLENEKFSIKDKSTFEKIDKLVNSLKKENIQIYGNFTDFHFDKKYFFDGYYHLNSEGNTLRTKAFIKMLNELRI